MEKQDAVVAAAQQQPMKFSRYRSVRKAAAKTSPDMGQHPHPPPSIPLSPATASSTRRPSTSRAHQTMATDNGPAPTIQRSMSRYRRQRAPPSRASSSDATSLPPVPVPTDQILAYNARSQGPMPQRMRSRGGNAERKIEDIPNVNPFLGEDEEDDDQRELHRQNAMDSLTGGDPAGKQAPPVSRRPTTGGRTGKHSNERHRIGDGDLSESRRRLSREHKRRSLKDVAKATPPKNKIDPDVVAGDKLLDPRSPPGPGVDAPVSAVNAGERRVTVQYKKMSMELPVTPTTSATDLLCLASDRLCGEIDSAKFILMESFSEQGLERPLRQYEAVRDVMNSWAHDRENSLIVVPAASVDALALLDAQRVSAQQPAEVTLHLYYSQRPRKWDKRYITLRSDGQITVSKKEHGQDQVNVCHLSDFDIYSPTASMLSHNVKPPKKICQAIKSQQKSSMFLTTENFVHFFATNDKAIADRWYKAVQMWRSWYLVNMLGAGQKEEVVESPTEDDATTNQPPRPLLDLSNNFNPETSPPALGRSRSSRSKDLFSRKKPSREHGPPPASFPKAFADENDMPEPAPVGESAFAPSGLLGRTYTVRQRAMKEREDREKRATEEPFIGQGLVGTMATRRSGPSSRSNTMTSTQAPDLTGLMSRSQSQKIRPLVDLTPAYQEPPQHLRKGKGVTVERGQPLIDAATGPDAPGGIVIPPSSTWRRPPPPPDLPAAPSEGCTRMRSNTARSTSHHHRPQVYTAPASPISPTDGAPPREEPFLPNSLLARSAQLATAQGSTPIGHGVATGDRNASKPMLDMSPENPFAEGSLLRGL
ncbi:hypothetical protein FE257_011153 [Aspergillus nanangensis]|uniref:PH domain-containing protein n=1 Tax=Aspergillus nanangensis TaxID=2582783 RepID=A0AAD4CHU0_ASPNN|nr:hypothetical protein FE257_011153 [Aspergillus nanangensis]